MPWSMTNFTAFAVVHESVDEPPAVIDAGFAVSVQDGMIAEGGLTVTVAAQVEVWPSELVTVPEYTVVAVGETEREPPATGVTPPTP